MTSPVSISSNPLTFKDSWLCYLGSRIYRIAIETIESISNALSCPLVQPHSGKRLYQLVDTFCHSANQSEPYNKARIRYATHLMQSVEKDKDIFEKAKQVRTILQTHILGLSTLQNKDKQSLYGHVGYTLLGPLIDGFGKQIANRAFCALDQWDESKEKSPRDYIRLYKDLILQQHEIDSFVKLLQELNSHIPRELFIHELVLSRNKHLRDTPLERTNPSVIQRITEILQEDHYLQVKLQKRLQLIQQLPAHTAIPMDKQKIMQELRVDRDTQVEMLHYKHPSMFFPSTSSMNNNFSNSCDSVISDKELEEEFQDAPEFSTPEIEQTSTIDEIELPSSRVSIQSFESPGQPIGIANTNQNCWYNSALQVIANTSLCYDIFLERSGLPSVFFPKIYESLFLYLQNYWQELDIRRIEDPTRYKTSDDVVEKIKKDMDNSPQFKEKLQSYQATKRFSPLFLTNEMQEIRAEIHEKIDPQFKDWGAFQEDSKNFLFQFLQKLSIDVARTTTWGKDLYTLSNKYVFIDKDVSHQVDLEELFFATSYRPEAVIIHTGTDGCGHYYAIVHHNEFWYLCDDSSINKISQEQVELEVKNNSAFIMAIRTNDDMASDERTSEE